MTRLTALNLKYYFIRLSVTYRSMFQPKESQLFPYNFLTNLLKKLCVDFSSRCMDIIGCCLKRVAIYSYQKSKLNS